MNPKTSNRTFTLRAGHWYAWQMLPGYSCEHYFSPIKVTSIIPIKSGNSMIRLEFYNAAYAAGVRDFDLELKVLVRAKKYMISTIYYGETSIDTRSAIIGQIGFWWLRRNFPGLLSQVPPEKSERDKEDLNEYLERCLKQGAI